MRGTGRRAAGLLVGAGVLFAVGTNVQSGWVLAMAAMLAGALLAGLILPVRMVGGVEVERRAPAEATAGEEVEVDLVVRNRSRRTKLSLLVRDGFVAPAAAFVPSLGPDERVRVTTRRFPARRGIVEGEPVTVSSTAPFGVISARRSVPAPGRTVVYPRVEPLSRLLLLDRAVRPEPAARPVPRRGTGQDFMGVREYRPGDSLRHVHWPSTARQGTLIVREYEREEPLRLTILVDTLADGGRSPSGESPLDLVCAVAASAAVRAMAEGALVRLLATAPEGADGPAGAGRLEALEWLAGLRPSGVPVDRLADHPGVDGTEPVAIVATTWAANAERLPRLARELAGRGASVQAVLVDAASFGDAGEAALDAEGTSRLRDAVAGAGAAFAPLASGEPLAPALAGTAEMTR